MKWFPPVTSGLLTAALLVGGTGCTRETKTTEGAGGRKLTLRGPSDTSVKPDETASIDVGITRDKFNDPVALTFAGLPAGVTVMESDRTISKDATSAKLTLKAAADAPAVSDHKVTVTATGGGMTEDVSFKVTVKANENAKKLTLSGPSDTSVKQDETASINIGITRDKFNAPVALTFAGLPAGVTIMESDRTISKDATSAKLTLKAAADAPAVTDHKVTVTASGGGMAEDVSFKVTVKGGDNAKKLTLSGPSDTSVKQDDTATINVGITRDKFNAPVALTFTNLPAGVTVMESDRTISKDATSAKLTLKAAADAQPMDDHKVTVTATGGGLTQEATFKVTVKKKG